MILPSKSTNPVQRSRLSVGSQLVILLVCISGGTPLVTYYTGKWIRWGSLKEKNPLSDFDSRGWGGEWDPKGLNEPFKR